MKKDEQVDPELLRLALQRNLGWCHSIYATNNPKEMLTFLENWAKGKDINITIENGIAKLTVPATEGNEKDRHVVFHTRMSFDSRGTNNRGNIRSLSLLMTILESEISHGNLTGIVNISGKEVDVTNLPKGTIFIDLNEGFEFGCCFNQSPGGGTVEALKNFTEKDVPEGYKAYRITVDDTTANAVGTIANFLWMCNQKLEIGLHSISGGCLYKAKADIVVSAKDENSFVKLAKKHSISVQSVQETTCKVLDLKIQCEILGALVACPNDETYKLISLEKEESSFVVKFNYHGNEDTYNRIYAIWQLAGATITPIVKCMPLSGDNSKTAFEHLCWAEEIIGQKPKTDATQTLLEIGNVVYSRPDLHTICFGTGTDELETPLQVLCVFLDNNLLAEE